MRVILLRSWANEQGRKYPIGSILQLFPTLAKQLIQAGKAREYNGKYPPQKKVKLNLNTR